MIRTTPITTSLRVVALAVVLAALAACGDDPAEPQPDPPAGLMADFSLPDVNPNSTRDGEMVSPRDYVGSISSWYFGHST